MQNVVNSFIEKYNLKNQKIFVGFSGGVDSTCLLHILKNAGLNICALHLNHDLRGEESDKEEEYAKKFCNSLNIPFICEKLINPPKNEEGLRNLRYDFFWRNINTQGGGVLFCAHNKDDNAETILYRLIKGTASKGVLGIFEHANYKNIEIYRPILNVWRKTIEEYVKLNNLPANIDSSNADIKYSRNLIRHKIFPLLKTLNPKVDETLLNFSSIIKNEDEFIDNHIKDLNILKENKIELSSYINAQDPIQKRVIYSFLKLHSYKPDSKKIKEIQDFILNSTKKMSLDKTRFLIKTPNRIEVFTKKQKDQTQIEIKKEGVYFFNGIKLIIEKYEKTVEKFPAHQENIAYVNLNGYDFNFCLRFRKEGDIFSPFGMKGKMKLKEFFINSKIQEQYRDNMPLLAYNNEILWVLNFRLSEKLRVKNIITHKITYEKES